MKKKKILIIVSTLAIILSLTIITYTLNKNKNEPQFIIEGIEIPQNKDILNDTTINNLKISNISLITKNELSTFKASITNIKEENTKINKLYVVFHINNQKHKILALYDTTITKEEKYINITTETILTNTTKIEYIIE